MIRFVQALQVADTSQVPAARRVATLEAERAGLSASSVAHAALVATELATNLLKHANGGSILIGTSDLRARSFSILAIDKGRGIQNVDTALRDGYSTAGTQGNGLGAVRRHSVLFDLYSLPDRGTAILSCIEDDRPSPTMVDAPPRIAVAGIALPKPGEEQNGDAWTAVPGRDVYTVGVIDGLGHGPAAETASSGAVRVIVERADQNVEGLIADMHAALRPTRGAAVGIARIHASAGRVDFLGIGNIAGTIASDETLRKTVSLPGIVGHEMRKLQTFSYPWNASSVLVLQSDGISASWNSASYPGLMQHHPALIAGVLYRDYCRGNDDATVVVVKAT